MKPALKYALVSILHEAGEKGIWEYEMYELLREKYEKSSICSMREELVGFSNIGWLSVLAIREMDGHLLRKYRLQKRHHDFIRYQLQVEEILRELGITKQQILHYHESAATSAV
ncbi:hypothetical protein [Brevibacillus massiliensis]|uniref:hypothetical protein n=1 Tax=Brevibacillus massiliensis TaxID=1118054 RepID=UPI00036B0933|nr:hypothetical protein [Brevibacillus massiliensis]